MQVGSRILVRNRREIRQTVRAVYFNNSLVKILIERDPAARQRRGNSSQTNTVSPSVGVRDDAGILSLSSLRSERGARSHKRNSWARRPIGFLALFPSARESFLIHVVVKPAPRVRRKSREWVTQLDEPPLLSTSPPELSSRRRPLLIQLTHFVKSEPRFDNTANRIDYYSNCQKYIFWYKNSLSKICEADLAVEII